MTADDPGQDARLAERLREAIRATSTLRNLAIEVEVHDGYLTLSGVVDDDEQRRAVQKHAEGLDGCRGVFNRLEAAPQSAVADDDLVRHVRDALAAQMESAPPIEVLADNGVITLTGAVVSHWERIIAEDAARGAAGVAGVQNQLEVRPQADGDDDALARDIRAALAYTRGVRESAIDVVVRDGAVRLTGRVGDEEERTAAEAVARRFRVRALSNELEIAGPAAEAVDE